MIRRTTVLLPKDIHLAAKQYAVGADRALQDVVAEAVKLYVGWREGGAKSVIPTGGGRSTRRSLPKRGGHA